MPKPIKQKGFTDLSEYALCAKCGLPRIMYMCLECGIAGEKREKCEDCGEFKKLDKYYHDNCK